MHLDNELDARQHAEVTAHLRTCQRCADTLRLLTVHEARLRSVLPGLRAVEAHGRACYSAEELSAYASGLLLAQEEAQFEQHLYACDVCLREVMAIRGTLHLLQREPLISPPVHLVATVQKSFAGTEQPSVVEQLGALIVQVAADGLKFVEALLLPEHVRLAVGGQLVPAGAWRSAREETVAQLDMQQRVRDLTLHISMLQEAPQTVLLRIQLHKQGKPLARKRVSLSIGGRLLASSNTSARGEVEFARLTPGEYTIRMPQENVETRLVLRAPEGTASLR
jgi:anti-sigma factor RsiW